MQKIKQEIIKRLEEMSYDELIKFECFTYKVDPEDIAVELEVDAADVRGLLNSKWYDQTLEDIRLVRTEHKQKQEDPYFYFGVARTGF